MVDPVKPIVITVDPAQEIVDVVPPAGGSITVREDTITYTPDPGTSGRQEIEFTYIDRAGERTSATIVVNVRPLAARTVLPAALRLGSNTFAVNLPKSDVEVRCAPLMRAKSAGDVRLCTTSKSGARTVVTVNGPARVTLSVLQRGNDGAVSLVESRSYTVRRSA